MDLQRLVLVSHASLAVWLLVNGVAHQLGVLLGAWRGTLRHPEALGPMLAVGGGLLIAGALISWSLASLSRGATGLASMALVTLVLVILATAARFGWTFLSGTVLLAGLDVLVLMVFLACARPQLQ